MKKIFVLFALVCCATSAYSQNWQKVVKPTTNYNFSMAFFGDSVGYLPGYPVTIKTIDKGSSWIVADSNEMGKIQAVTKTTGFRMLTKRVNGSIKDISLQKTTNQGKDWTTIISPEYPWEELANFHFRDSIHGIVADGFPDAKYFGAFKTTSDGGITWTPARELRYMSMNDQLLMINDSVIIATGFHGPFFPESRPTCHADRSSDTGKYWGKMSGPSTSHFFPNKFYFVHENLGYATSSGGSSSDGSCTMSNPGLSKSTDLGKTWFQVLDIPLADIHFSQDGRFGAALISSVKPDSNKRLILRTNDGGTSWGLQQVNDNTDVLQRVFVLDSAVAFLVGANGTVLRTENGGGPITNLPVSVEEENDFLKETKAYPNPTANELIIDGISGELTLISSFGEVVWRGFKNEEKLKIDVSALPQGIYVLKHSAGIYVLKHSAGAQMISVVR